MFRSVHTHMTPYCRRGLRCWSATGTGLAPYLCRSGVCNVEYRQGGEASLDVRHSHVASVRGDDEKVTTASDGSYAISQVLSNLCTENKQKHNQGAPLSANSSGVGMHGTNQWSSTSSQRPSTTNTA